MAYPSKFDELEKRYGKPIADILVEQLNEQGSIEHLARTLDISYRHVFQKVKDCGIEKSVRYHLPEVNHADA